MAVYVASGFEVYSPLRIQTAQPFSTRSDDLHQFSTIEDFPARSWSARMASGVTEPPCSANGVAREEAEDSELHRAAFEGDLVRARELLVVGRVDPNAHDTHGRV